MHPHSCFFFCSIAIHLFAFAPFRFLFFVLQLASLALEKAEKDDDLTNLRPSAAPPRGSRRDLMKKMPSQSIKNLLDTVETPDTR